MSAPATLPIAQPVMLPAAARLREPIHLDLLDPAARKDWGRRVLQLREHWRPRHPVAPFFTLGLAAYLDHGPHGTGLYADDAARHAANALLDAQFRPLLDTVAAALSARLGAPAVLAAADDRAALPGFHIYLPHPAFGKPVANVHRDLQFRDVFPAHEPTPGGLISFTLSLSTPPGSGLRHWPAEPAESDGNADGEPAFFPYRDGMLVVHDGLVTHQAVLACDGGVARITLQGHGLQREDGRFVLYW
ncbi:hypothetical protein [Burkholderia sp. 3C]